MAPVTSPSTVTLASETRWINAITSLSSQNRTTALTGAVVDATKKTTGKAMAQANSSLTGFSYSPRQAVVSAPSNTTNQLR